MADWQQYLESVFFGVVFSFLLAKLFSVIFAFREDNLRITRADTSENTQSDSPSEDEAAKEPLITEQEKSLNDRTVASDLSDTDSDDWEGVDSTELDEMFSAATAFVAATAADRNASKVSNDVQLNLYGLYKIATEGACLAPQPSALKMTARAKWQAWHKLGAMPPEEAMEKYIDIVTELYPSWADGAAIKKKDDENSEAPAAGSKGPMGPVFSSLMYEEESASELKMDAIHVFAQEGDEEKLLKCIECGVPLNLKDSEGRTALHWAVDRGHNNITSLLLNKNADVNAKDDEGQTPLHYAAVCDRADIAELLVRHGADIEIRDSEGYAPRDLCELRPPWLELVKADES